MVVPKKSDRLIQHLMKSGKKNKESTYTPSEESEFRALEWDMKQGINLTPHKMERYLALKQLLGK